MTVSRESFWNHSIKKWSDTTTPFISNDSIICFIAFLEFLVHKMASKKTQKIGVYLGLSPKFYHFFSVPLIFCWEVFSYFKTDQKPNLDYQPWYASGNVWFVLIILAKYSLLLISWLKILWRTLPPYLFTQGKQICCVGFPAIYSSS